MTKFKILSAAALSVALLATPAMAQRMGGFHGGGFHGGGWGGGGWHGGGWHGGGWRGAGVGFGTGLLLGSALGYGAYGYGPGYGPYAYDNDEGYYADVAPTYAPNAAYCAQRYKSYDPNSGTFLGYDGQRHPCQ